MRQNRQQRAKRDQTKQHLTSGVFQETTSNDEANTAEQTFINDCVKIFRNIHLTHLKEFKSNKYFCSSNIEQIKDVDGNTLLIVAFQNVKNKHDVSKFIKLLMNHANYWTRNMLSELREYVFEQSDKSNCVDIGGMIKRIEHLISLSYRVQC